jgi:hypothetical protein
MAAILFTRVKSALAPDELVRRVNQRMPRFREVPGLIQKFYGSDEETGDVCGIFLFEDENALAAYRNSELAQTAPGAYEVLNVRAEVFDVLTSLFPEKGPPLP